MKWFGECNFLSSNLFEQLCCSFSVKSGKQTPAALFSHKYAM